MVYDLRTTSKQAKQRERLRKKERKRDGETHREICDRGDGDERRMSAGKKREGKQNAGQASKDYCMKVV